MYQEVSDLVVEGVLPLLAPERRPGHHGLRRRHPGGDEPGHAAGAVRRRQRQQVRHVGTAAKVAALLNTPKLQTVFVVQKPFNTYVVVPECFQPANEIESLRISRKLLKAVQHELYLDARVAVPLVGGGNDVVDLGQGEKSLQKMFPSWKGSALPFPGR